MDLESHYVFNALLAFLSLPMLMVVPWMVEKLGYGPERAMLMAQRAFLFGFVAVVLTLTLQFMGVEMAV